MARGSVRSSEGLNCFAVLELTGHFVDPAGQKPNTINPHLVK